MTKITEEEFPGIHELKKVLEEHDIASLPELRLQSTIRKDLPQALLDLAEVVHALDSIDSKAFDALCSHAARRAQERALSQAQM